MIHNTNSSYGIISIINHWIGGLLFLTILGMGFYMELLPRSPLKYQLYDLHQFLSIFLMVLFVIRILWKFMTPTPNIIRSFPLWEMYLAKVVHILLFWSLALMPVSGWVVLNARDEDLFFVYGIVLPRLVEPSASIELFAQQLHIYLSQFILLCLSLHILGTIKHHLIDRDNTFKRIIKPEKLWFNGS
tara:strand:- start:1557 stop:2120 length:564 start_codon:yes stop_codon:yes gene_type:complete